jgi:hypothetical protein
MALALDRRGRLEMQGYAGLSDADIDEIELWTRLSPALCMAVMIIGTALASPWVLGALTVTAVIGTALPVHPFDLIYNLGIRRLTGTRPLPPNGAPRRFACGLAAAWLIGTAAAFASGATVAGYVLGGVLAGVASLVATVNFCIPSLIFRTCEAGIARQRKAAA